MSFSSETLIIPTFIAVLVLVFFLARMLYLSRKRGTPDQIPAGFRVYKKHWILNHSSGQALPIQILALWMHMPYRIQQEYGYDFRIFLTDPVIQAWATLWRTPNARSRNNTS